MSKPMPVLPPLDLASLSIHDLWCLSDLFENLAHTAMNFLNQPRVSDADSVPSTFAYALWNDYLHGTNGRIIEEISRRQPSDRSEADWKAEAIIRHLSQGDSFHEILEAAAEAIRARSRLAA